MAASITNPEELVQFALSNADNRDPATIFGSAHAQDETQLKRAYKKIALRLHPDKNHHPDAGRAFQIIQSTFEIGLERLQNPGGASSGRGQQQQQQQRQQDDEAAQAAAAAQAKYEEEMREYERQMAEYEEAKRAHKAAKMEAKRQKEAQEQQQFKQHAAPPMGDFEEFPLPPEVFEDGGGVDDEWENDPADFASATKSSSKKNTVPPPPPPTTSGGGKKRTQQGPPPPNTVPPPPPTQQRASGVEKKRKKSSSAVEQQEEEEDFTGGGALPSLDLSSEDEIEALERLAKEKKKEKKRKQAAAAAATGLMNLSDSDDDEETLKQKKVKAKESEKARKQRELLEEQAAEEVARQKKSAQSLSSLFAKHGITMEEDDDDWTTSSSSSSVKPKKKPSVSAGPQSPLQQPAKQGRKASGTTSSSPLYASSPLTPEVAVPKVKKSKIQCPHCLNPVTYTDPAVAALCRNCNKYFIPAQVMAPPSGASAQSKSGGARCKCGAAKKGSCFLCGV